MSKQQNNKNILKDHIGRQARYLRVSITDRCNFKCLYCRDLRHLEYIPHENILRYEEILRFAQIMKNLGVGKIRITGGEPFARKNCMRFLLDLRKAFPDLRLCLTTNASLLEPWLDDLERFKPDSINISLDSFKDTSFAQITGSNSLPIILKNIDKLLSRSLRVKLNAVALRGITDKEIDNFIHAVREMPVDLRFIEFMPMGNSTSWSEAKYLPSSELFELFNEKVPLKPIAREDKSKLDGPAKMYNIENAKGRIGFISALSDHFCGECNRLRLTSDGKLRTCLFSDKEYALSSMLRNKAVTDDAILKAVLNAHHKKPLGVDLLHAKQQRAVSNKEMSGIGG